MSIEIRQEGYTASCDSCGRSWRAYECREKEAELRDGLRVDDWWTTPTEHGIEVYCPRCDGEAMARREERRRCAEVAEGCTCAASPEHPSWVACRVAIARLIRAREDL